MYQFIEIVIYVMNHHISDYSITCSTNWSYCV